MGDKNKSEASVTERKGAAENVDPDVLVRVENLGKIFCRDFKKSLFYGFKDSIKDLTVRGGANPGEQGDGERDLRESEFWANQSISFELRRGECLGLIGHNGAGKTTLLKMLNGLIKPDQGKIEIRGRIGALIALGAGFNPLLTGRENIYVNASVLGLSRDEIEDKIESIIEFSEIRDFIDAPVQTYSSGMQVRLGFAVATALDPDVLFLDEILAVGDVAFRAKCTNRIAELRKTTAIIFVSHNVEQIMQMSTKGLHLSGGKISHYGHLPDVIGDYLRKQSDTSMSETSGQIAEHESLEGTKVSCRDEVQYGDEIVVSVETTCLNDCVVDPRLVLISPEGSFVWESDFSNYEEGGVRLSKGKNRLSITFGQVNLKTGVYFLDLFLNDSEDGGLLFRSYRNVKVVVSGAPKSFGFTISDGSRRVTVHSC